MKIGILKRILLLSLFTILFLLVNSNVCFAGSQELNELKFDIEIMPNGDMKVIETWDVDIEETNTLFKTFPIDSTYDGIEDVSVIEILDSGVRKEFIESNSYAYHVDENYFQGLLNPDNDFEIAWGVNVEDYETRKFEIMYTIKNHVTLYDDCAEVYWKFVGDNFEIPSEDVTGTIKIPKGLTDIEDLKVWAHGPLNGNIERIDTETVKFDVSNLSSNTFLEIRLAMPTALYELSNKYENISVLEDIITEETEWAEEANQKREEQLRKQKIIEIFTTIGQGLLSVLFFTKILKYKEMLKNIPKRKPEQEYEYFRDLPEEKLSVGDVSYIYHGRKQLGYGELGQIMSGTFLNLCLKGWILFEQSGKNSIIVINNNGKKALTKDEQTIYDYIINVAGEDNKFSMKDFEKYSKSNTTKFEKLFINISKNLENQAVENGILDLEQKKISEQYAANAVLYGIALCCMIPMFIIPSNPIVKIVLSLILFLNLVFSIKLASRVTGFTQKAINDKSKYKGLKKYMAEFSMLDERDIPELALWEKYLVFATAFGIADKVIKQLKVKFPELQDEEYVKSHYSYMHMACNSSNNFNFVNSIQSSITNSVNYSSGSGSGGGFSGGGGGGRRRRWRRRPLIKL